LPHLNKVFGGAAIFVTQVDKTFTNLLTPLQQPARLTFCKDMLRKQVVMETMLVELEAEIVELEETIPDPTTRDRLLGMPKKLFTEAREYHRKGNVQETRLTLNSAYRLVERAKRELKK